MNPIFRRKGWLQWFASRFSKSFKCLILSTIMFQTHLLNSILVLSFGFYNRAFFLIYGPQIVS